MSDLAMEFELNQNHKIAPNHLRVALAKIEAYSEERSGDEPQGEETA